jgi:cbb3-type cytochrome oxidase maturation protein
MSVIVLLIVAGGTVAAGFLGAFVWAVRSGQFDDTCTPAIRMLFDDGTNGHDAVPRARTADVNRERRPR